MRRTRVALIVSVVWLAALVVTGAVSAWLGIGWPAAAFGGVAAGLAGLASLGFARREERSVERKLAALAAAVGAVGGDDLRRGTSIEAVIANLAGRLERASPFKAGFAALDRPALLAAGDGEILGVTRGLSAMVPGAIEGAPLDVLLGEGYAAGGLREEELISINGLRHVLQHRAVGAGRQLLEFVPAGAYLADDDIDAFAAALAAGQTGLRFDPAALEHSPALRALSAGLESLDAGVRALNRLAAGDLNLDDIGTVETGIAPQVRAVSDLMAALVDTRDELTESRDELERKCAAVLAAVERQRDAAATLAGLSDESRAGLGAAAQSMERGRERLGAVQRLGREARQVLDMAQQAAGRTSSAASGVETASGEIDRMMSAIEDVSFRTNLLALNAAVEAARAGEKGAGFAVVADEVRMLAQLTQKTSREIRELVGANRSRSSAGAAEAAGLRTMIVELERHLESLGSETDGIVGAFEEGRAALARAEQKMAAIGGEAAQGLAPPARRPVQAGGRG
jgi:methyl-accepting chemotaxis protein